MPITLYDVALRAGVSPSTVSRVLNGARSGLPISAATRQRVQVAARALGYRANLTARSLSTRRTRTIGLVLPREAAELHDPYNAMIVAGLSEVLVTRGYSLGLYFSQFAHRRQGPNHASLLQDGRVDGGLIVDSYMLDDDQVAELEQEAERFPFVLIGHRLPESRLHWVAADDRGGAAALVEHLLELGHRRIAHVCNLRGHPAHERYLGYTQTLAAHQATARPEWVVRADALAGLWVGPERPTAVFAWNDYAALAVLRALHEADLAVPRDVSVVGYDDFSVAALALPALTTVREPLYELGALAAETLLEVLCGRASPVQRLLPTELVLRESSAPAAQPERVALTSTGWKGGDAGQEKSSAC